MTSITCPVCGTRSLIAYGTDLWGDYGPAVLAHTVPGAPMRSCVTSRMNPEDAEAVGRILAEGGERFRLAAHP